VGATIDVVLSKSCVPGMGVAAEASVVSGMCAAKLQGMLLHTRLAGDITAPGNALNPFATLWRKYFTGDASQAHPAASIVTLSGLTGSLVGLNNVYQYHSEVEGRPAYKSMQLSTDQGNPHYIYWSKEYPRWYVGPEVGNSNILVYGEATTTLPLKDTDCSGGSWTAWNGTEWLQSAEYRCSLVKPE
jgi:hypothetical protein